MESLAHFCMQLMWKLLKQFEQLQIASFFFTEDMQIKQDVFKTFLRPSTTFFRKSLSKAEELERV